MGRTGFGRSSRAWSRRALFLVTALIGGCITVHAPLRPDADYPDAWGEIVPLGPECNGIAGTYSNVGSGTGTDPRSVSLLGVLGSTAEASTVSLTTHTRRIDQNGDAFVTLRVTAPGGVPVLFERDGCFCIEQSLACTQIDEKYWSVPNFGVGGSQRNVYLALAGQRALVAKLQNYHADVLLGIPTFRMKEPWVRFPNVNP